MIVPAALVFNNFVVIAIVLATLYFSREILVPIVLAVLISFVLAPLVKIFQGRHLPRAVAVLLAVAGALVVTVSLTTMVMVQVNQLAKDLPRYQVTLNEKIHSLHDFLGPSGLFKDASGLLKDLGKELETPDQQGQAASPGLARSEFFQQAYSGRSPSASARVIANPHLGSPAFGQSPDYKRDSTDFRDVLFVSARRFAQPVHPAGWQWRH